MGSVHDDDLRDVIHREHRLLDPSVRARADDVDTLLHPDALEHGASGRVWDRDSIIAALLANPASPADDVPDGPGEPVDVSAERLTDDVVLITYRIAGPPGSLRSSIWVRTPEIGWRLRFHQGTPLPAEQ